MTQPSQTVRFVPHVDPPPLAASRIRAGRDAAMPSERGFAGEAASGGSVAGHKAKPDQVMRRPAAAYADQRLTWPDRGRHILAAYDDDTITVYQAYRPDIGRHAVEHQRFGGPFSFGRMSWVKPNFLWMMYRSGWGTKPDQTVTLAVTLPRPAFDAVLAAAVHSAYVADVYGDAAAWRAAVAGSDVRLQWDPDHGPTGEPVERRAVQLGLRGETLRRYATEWPTRIEDVSPFVAAQRAALVAGGPAAVVLPVERVYPVFDVDVANRLGIDPVPADVAGAIKPPMSSAVERRTASVR